MSSDLAAAKPGIPRNPNAKALDPFHGVDFSKMERSLRRPRTFMSMLFTVIVSAMTLP